MLKLIGAAAILCGCASALWSWHGYRKRRLRQLEETVRFLGWLGDAVTRQHRTLPECFESYPAGDAALAGTLSQTAKLLRQNRYRRGDEAWKHALEETRGEWCLSAEQRELLTGLCASFFAGSSRRIGEALGQDGLRLTDALERDRAEYRRQRRVFAPVGMLTGLMLIVILM